MRSVWAIGLVLVCAGCADRSFTPTLPQALTIGTNKTVFAATSRAKSEIGTFGYQRSDRLSLLELTVSVPPNHQPGELVAGYRRPDPQTEFAMAARREFPTMGAFRDRVETALTELPADQREVTVFVHGYNATQAETAFRAAQLATDIGLPGIMTIYSWPSRGRALGYVYDIDSMLFARDGLETLFRQMRAAGARRIILVAHSLGAALAMETLRQIELQDPGWSAANLGGVILISPDINPQVFHTQMRRLHQVPRPFVIFVSGKDNALNLSARLRGGQARLGNIGEIDTIADLPVEIIDTTDFADGAGSAHFIPATSPALIAMLNRARTMNATFESEVAGLQGFGQDTVTIVNRAVKITLRRDQGGVR